MIPGITPAIITRSEGGGMDDGYYDVFLTDSTAAYFTSERQAPSPGAGVITYDPMTPGLVFDQHEAWSGIGTPDFPVLPGADYEVTVISDNLGPTGQTEGYVWSGSGGGLLATMSPRVAVNKSDVVVTGVVTAVSDIMSIYWEIRSGGASSFRVRAISAVRL